VTIGRCFEVTASWHYANMFIAVWCYARLVLAIIVCPSVSIWLSHASIISEWLNAESYKQCHTIAQGL